MTTPFHKYLVNDVLPKYQVPQNELEGLRKIYDDLWQNDLKKIHKYNPRPYYGGSYAKGTMIKGSYDLDFVIYFPSTITSSIKEIVEYVKQIISKKFSIEHKGVALQLKKGNYEVDLVVGKAQDNTFQIADLYNKVTDSAMRTSLAVHIENVAEVEPIIRLMKIWRLYHKLNWHKLAMEQTIVRVLQNKTKSDYGDCFKEIFLDIKSNIDSVRFLDPANCNNPIFVNDNERKRIKDIATNCYNLMITNSFNNIIR